jgi:predicted phosphodiesterase
MNDNGEKMFSSQVEPLLHQQIDLPGEAGHLYVDIQYESRFENDSPLKTRRVSDRGYNYPRVREIKSTTWRYHKINLLALVDIVLSGAGITHTGEQLQNIKNDLKEVTDAFGLEQLLYRWKPEEEGLLMSALSTHKSSYRAGTATWLHLSDLHCEVKDDYDRAIVLETLWDDIKNRHQTINQDLKELDCAFLTGDLAYHGTEQEYRFIETKVLPELFDATGLDETRLFVVPGNHDICQAKVPDVAKAGRERLLKDLKTSTSITKALTDAGERSIYFQRLEAYYAFCQQAFSRIEIDQEGGFYIQSVTLPSSITIAILGLNSAWLSYGGQADRGQLALGEFQVDKAIRTAKKMHPDLLIALDHHPFEWLADNQDRHQVELLLRRNCHFMLQGHRHRTKVFQEETLDGKMLTVLAGAGYDDRYSFNRYNFVKLNLDNGEGIIYFRRYSDAQRGWLPDSDSTGTANGTRSFTLDL